MWFKLDMKNFTSTFAVIHFKQKYKHGKIKEDETFHRSIQSVSTFTLYKKTEFLYFIISSS